MNATKQILNSHICPTDNNELKELPVDKTVLHICSTNEDESNVIALKKCSTEGKKNRMRSQKYKKKTQRMRQMMRNLQL